MALKTRIFDLYKVRFRNRAVVVRVPVWDHTPRITARERAEGVLRSRGESIPAFVGADLIGREEYDTPRVH